MRTRDGRAWAWTLAGLLWFGAALHAAEGIDVVPLVRDGDVLVSFNFTDGVDDNLRAAIRSGLETTFTYAVDLRLDVPAWRDQTIASVTLSNTVQFDTLTRRHTMVRSVDGRVQETRITEDPEVVREWLTELHRVPLFSARRLEQNRDYYVRVRATTRPQNVLFPLPWREGPSGQTRFTFIP